MRCLLQTPNSNTSRLLTIRGITLPNDKLNLIGTLWEGRGIHCPDLDEDISKAARHALAF